MSWLFTFVTDGWPRLLAASISCQCIDSRLSSTGLGLTCVTLLCKWFHLRVHRWTTAHCVSRSYPLVWIWPYRRTRPYPHGYRLCLSSRVAVQGVGMPCAYIIAHGILHLLCSECELGPTAELSRMSL